MRIVWTDLAKANVREIYDYYKKVGSEKIAKSITRKIVEKSRLLTKQPDIGQLEESPEIAKRDFKYLVEGNYKIVYKNYFENNEILIAAVFDTRQNPSKLKI